jgi:AcrR family transcriptional regulator
MAVQPGLRERKKQQTRQHIFEAAQRLFAEKGFERVTVAEVAGAAEVSEVTVFNYFPTKEDLFYGGMQFFEEQLLDAVRRRPRGEPPIKAFRRLLLESSAGLGAVDRLKGVVRAAEAMSASPSLAAREREIVDRYTRELARILAADTKADPGDVEPLAAAAALMGAHRAIVDYVRRQALAGQHGTALVDDTRAQTRRALSRLERGLGRYAVRA